jgi:hypothetical protein
MDTTGVVLGWLERVAARLQQSDLLQLLFGYFVVLTFVLLVTWPPPGQAVNNSWYALEQTNVIALVVLALAYGSWLSDAPAKQLQDTLAALVSFQVLSLPLKVASYAATFPGVPLWWVLLIVTLTVIAFFGIGLAVGRGFDALRLAVLKPLSAPIIVAAVFGLDVSLGRPLLNPFGSLAEPSWTYGLTISGLALAVIVYLWRMSESSPQPHS